LDIGIVKVTSEHQTLIDPLESKPTRQVGVDLVVNAGCCSCSVAGRSATRPGEAAFQTPDPFAVDDNGLG